MKRMSRKPKLLIVSIPLVGVLMALGAVIFSRLKGVPLPENTWAVLFSCAGITAANGYLAAAIGAAQEEALRRDEDQDRAAPPEKQYLLIGLIIAAVLIEILYIRYIAEHPYGHILVAGLLLSLSLYGLWFALTRHDELWEAYRQAAAGNTPFGHLPYMVLRPFRMLYESYHWMPSRIFYGVCSALSILIGAWGLWMEPTAVAERAQGGEAKWQYEAALLYVAGDGLPRDPDKAFALYLAAARQGYGRAYFHLGRMYREGLGTARDLAEAARWFRKGAEAGDHNAWNSLGLAYANGEGLEQNPVEAAKCFRHAAEDGNPNGRYNLGLAYESGFGLAADKGLALYWYERVADDYQDAREKAKTFRAQGVRPKKP